MQRVDDVTGEPLSGVRMSAAEREQQRAAMVQRLHELTAANNALYARVVACEASVSDALAKCADALTSVQFMEARVVALERPKTWLERVAWR
jgi:hypothetical protein